MVLASISGWVWSREEQKSVREMGMDPYGIIFPRSGILVRG